MYRSRPVKFLAEATALSLAVELGHVFAVVPHVETPLCEEPALTPYNWSAGVPHTVTSHIILDPVMDSYSEPVLLKKIIKS